MQKRNNDSLMNSIKGRIQKLQHMTLEQQSQIRGKQLTIDKLAGKLKKFNLENNIKVEIFKEQTRNDTLKKELSEIRQFMSQYKKKDSIQLDLKKINKEIVKEEESKPKFKSRLPKKLSIKILSQRIQDLNFIAQRDSKPLTLLGSDGIHRISTEKPQVSLIFYKEGLLLQDLPFMMYNSVDGKKILEEIYEGYFPSQLRKKYPDGVLIQAVNLTRQLFKSQQKEKVEVQEVLEVQEVQEEEEKFEEVDEMLEKDKNGNFIVMGLTEQCYRDGSFDIQEICQLRVRFEGRTYLVKALKQQTILPVYEDIEEHMPEGFRLLVARPRQVIDRGDERTLEEIGLFPNANLVAE